MSAITANIEILKAPGDRLRYYWDWTDELDTDRTVTSVAITIVSADDDGQLIIFGAAPNDSTYLDRKSKRTVAIGKGVWWLMQDGTAEREYELKALLTLDSNEIVEGRVTVLMRTS